MQGLKLFKTHFRNIQTMALGSTCSLKLTRSVPDLGDGSLDVHLVASLERHEVLGHDALRVALDQQVKVAGLQVGRDRSVGAEHVLAIRTNRGLDSSRR